MRRCSGLDAVERRERAAEHVVEAPVLGRRSTEIRSTGCSTTQIMVWSRRASRQIAHTLLLGQVAALAAETDALLDLLDRRREASASSAGR